LTGWPVGIFWAPPQETGGSPSQPMSRQILRKRHRVFGWLVGFYERATEKDDAPQNLPAAARFFQRPADFL